MLPNRMQLARSVEEQLKQLKIKTGITPNVSARIAFFKSIETEYRFDFTKEYKTDGSLILDKITWLGKTQQMTELLLLHNYPKSNSKELQLAWASHVEHGIASLRNMKSLSSFVEKL